ncbi:hypothetical protein DIT71_09225 [Marinobacter vulgaris]|uniref:Glycosyltransferase 2-like domain-containing protein n=1 Tax=Marinobacter vulgaris TaxID=1928331 RepID=A0A2V3ZK12_9GAMM|nr:glycosyltransferase family 2 protein [Marinobacter vulgaris]PXX90718.1 hypothetical protein DIT71_09225 [Marinobacter vulgaris]TSJ70310.1 glycosyltransferase family 2 protein [Marinobacter vulgaris]
MIKLSIIIPYKDSGETLLELLGTIPDTPEYEIILIDDRSEKPFNENECYKRNLKIYRNDRPGDGPGTARNIGVSKSRGEWLVFADSDDWFTGNAFCVFERFFDSRSDIIYFRPKSKHDWNDQAGTRHKSYEKLVDSFLDYKSDWIRYRFHSPWSKMIRRSLFVEHQIEFDETIVANDLVCSLRLGLCADRIDACDETVYIVRQGRPGSLSSKRDEVHYNIRLENHIRYNSFLQERKLGDKRMGGLSILKRALSLGCFKFIKIFLIFLKQRQPILEPFSYYIMVVKKIIR